MAVPACTTRRLLCALLLWLAPSPAEAGDAPEVRVADDAPLALKLEPVGSGFEHPLFLTHAGDGSGRRFVVEQEGRVRILPPEGGPADKSKVFLDLTQTVRSGGERGLLGLAFHPDYKKNGQLFVYLTARDGAINVLRFTRSRRDSDKVDMATRKVILKIDNPAANHNGGMLAFGPDGYLYIGTGDGGGAGDPWQNGQNTGSLLGKLLRIDVTDVDGGKPYAVPETNPFVKRSTYRPEIWAYGLRNPWRFAFDRVSGDLFIADVGQDDWEEVNFQPGGEAGGQNYGWSLMEGRHCYPIVKRSKQRQETCIKGTLPAVEYSHGLGCSVTGGYVYRGQALRRLAGIYLLADYCSGTIWGLIPDPPREGRFHMRRYLETDLAISSFGEDEDGELYVVDHKRGGIYRIAHR